MMQVIELNDPNHLPQLTDQQYAMAIGFFDGLHKGHQAVIQTAIDEAKALGIQSAVMTFNPHPSHVLGGGKNKVGYITPYKEKVEVLTSLGVDTLFIVKFDEVLSSLTPEEFVDRFIRGLHVKHVVAGFDFTFGKKGAGTMEEMKALENGDYKTTVVNKVADDADKISSTRIRTLLAKGKVEEAASLLGRNFKLSGVVVHGAKDGRKLGFPTANVMPPEHTILPLNGVYAVKFTANGKMYDGVCSIGVKPTFQDDHPVLVEVFVLDFDGDLYDQIVEVEWLHFIREEQKFDSVEALIEQMHRDTKEARVLLAAVK